MRPTRHAGFTLATVAIVVVVMAAAAYAVTERRDSSQAAHHASVAAAKKSTKTTKKNRAVLRLTATPRTVLVGNPVTFRIVNRTRHTRVVRLQRYDPATKTWRNVAKKRIRAVGRIRVTPDLGSYHFRVAAPTSRDRAGGTVHRHRYARSKGVTVTVSPPTGRAQLNGDEAALVTSVEAARARYAPAQQRVDAPGGEACLTYYARLHSAWMASIGKAVDPGAPAHQAARRPMPSAICTGRNIQAITTVVGVPGTTQSAADLAVQMWLGSPYGSTDALLSACTTAPWFDIGVGITTTGSKRWMTVLVSSASGSTKASGVC